MNPKSTKPRRAVIPANCGTIENVYAILASDLALPRHFGHNLDALYDALTGDVPGPYEIVVQDAAALEAALGARGKALMILLRDVAKSRRDAKIKIEGRGSRRKSTGRRLA